MLYANILKVLFLFVGIWLSFNNIALICYKQELPQKNMKLQAFCIVGFLTLQFNMLGL